MSDKTRVTITSNDQYGTFKEGDTGFVDGYVRGANGIPCAVVFLEQEDGPSNAVMVPIQFVELSNA